MITNACNSAAYYHHSGRWSPLGVVIGGIASAAIAVAGALFYAWFIRHNPLIYANLAMVAAYGCLIGVSAVQGARIGKVRNERAMLILSTWTFCIGFYFAWVFWVMMLVTSGDLNVSRSEVVQPGGLWQAIHLIDEEGTWTLEAAEHFGHGAAVNGELLWAIWGAEALSLLAAAIAATRWFATSRPFCETCNAWCTDIRTLHRYRRASGVEMKLHLEQHDWPYLGTVGPARTREGDWLELQYIGCATCQKTRTLSLKRISEGNWRFGVPGRKSVVVMDKLLIDQRDLETISGIEPAEPQHQSRPAPRPGESDFVDLGL